MSLGEQMPQLPLTLHSQSKFEREEGVGLMGRERILEAGKGAGLTPNFSLLSLRPPLPFPHPNCLSVCWVLGGENSGWGWGRGSD